MTTKLIRLFAETKENHKPSNHVVLRLTTSTWADKHGLHTKRSLRYLRRQCTGYNILEEDSSNIGAAEVIHAITNLDQCPDGIYYVTTCNEERDWESGRVESYDYRLIPVPKQAEARSGGIPPSLRDRPGTPAG